MFPRILPIHSLGANLQLTPSPSAKQHVLTCLLPSCWSLIAPHSYGAATLRSCQTVGTQATARDVSEFAGLIWTSWNLQEWVRSGGQIREVATVAIRLPSVIKCSLLDSMRINKWFICHCHANGCQAGKVLERSGVGGLGTIIEASIECSPGKSAECTTRRSYACSTFLLRSTCVRD